MQSLAPRRLGLTGGIGSGKSTVAQVLVECGILKRRKDGLNVLYAIADKSIIDLCETVCGSVQRRLKERAGAFSG